MAGTLRRMSPAPLPHLLGFFRAPRLGERNKMPPCRQVVENIGDLNKPILKRMAGNKAVSPAAWLGWHFKPEPHCCQSEQLAFSRECVCGKGFCRKTTIFLAVRSLTFFKKQTLTEAHWAAESVKAAPCTCPWTPVKYYAVQLITKGWVGFFHISKQLNTSHKHPLGRCFAQTSQCQKGNNSQLQTCSVPLKDFHRDVLRGNPLTLPWYAGQGGSPQLSRDQKIKSSSAWSFPLC